MSNYADLVAEVTKNNPLAEIIGKQITSLADRLGEIAEKVNESDDNAEKRPTVGVVLKEAREKSENDESLSSLLEDYEKARKAAKVAYREVLVSLYPQFAGDDDEDETDDSERAILIADAKDVYGKIKAGLVFLSSQDGIPEDFANNFLGAIPVVEGARQRTSLGGDGTTIRPRFESVVISGPEGVNTTVKTFTDAVKWLKSFEAMKKVTNSDLADAWVAAGGSSDTAAGTQITFVIDEFEFVTIKK